MFPPTFPQTANINGFNFGPGSSPQLAPLGSLPAWQPQQPQPQFDPQSFWSALKSIAAHVPDAVKLVTPFLPQQAGPSLGQPPAQQSQFNPQDIWSTLASVVKAVAPLAPLVLLQAGPGQQATQSQPQPQQFAPQGIFDIIKTLASTVPGVLRMLPLQAGPSLGQPVAQQPQFDPQSFWSTLTSVVQAVAPLAPLVLLQAGPGQQQQPQPQFDPQSFWSTLKTIASYAPDAVQAISRFIPQQAGPLASQPSQLAPQSFFGTPWRPNWPYPGIVAQPPVIPFAPTVGQA